MSTHLASLVSADESMWLSFLAGSSRRSCHLLAHWEYSCSSLGLRIWNLRIFRMSVANDYDEQVLRLGTTQWAQSPVLPSVKVVGS